MSDTERVCSVCGEESEYTYRCSECGKLFDSSGSTVSGQQRAGGVN